MMSRHHQKPRRGKTVDAQMLHYLDVLGLKAGASPDQIAVAYFSARKALAARGTARAEERAATIDHAFAILKARARTRPADIIQRQVNRFLIAAVITLAILSGFSAFQVNRRLRPYLVSFSAGDHVYRADNRRSFGTVVYDDASHPFADGSRRHAYRIRLDDASGEIWMSARTATKALRKE
ncbi:MAG: hypothetical protein ACE5IK_06000 [Acidobacteriota bacterium]